MSENYQAIIESLRPLISSVRTDITALKRPGKGQYWTDEPLTDELMHKHLNGVQELRGVCPIREGESTTRVAVLDFDSHKGEVQWDDMQRMVDEVVEHLRQHGLRPALFRSSGGHGIHAIMMWQHPQEARAVRRKLRALIGELGYVDKAGGRGVLDHYIEVFPKQDTVPAGGKGNQFILPLGADSRYIDPCFGLIEDNQQAATMLSWEYSDPVQESVGRGVENELSDLEQVVANEPLPLSRDEVVQYLKAYPASELDYDQWVRVGAALHHQYQGSNEGAKLFNAWSKQDADRYDKAEVAKKWASFGKYTGQPMTMASIIKAVGGAGQIKEVTATGEVITKFEALKREALAISDDASYQDLTRRLVKMSKAELADDLRAQLAKVIHTTYGKAQGLNNSDIRKAIAHRGRSVGTVSKSALAYERDDEGYIKCNATNSQIFCASPGDCGMEIRYDTFIDAIMFRRSPDDGYQRFMDEHYHELMVRSEQIGFAFSSKERIRDAVYAVAKINEFDSARLWLDSLVWDGVPRVEWFFIRYFGVADSEYARAVGMYIWTAAAGRVMEPGIQADMTPVLVGSQGLRKTSGIKAMAPHKDYFSELSFGEKEDELARKMRGALICEIAELRGLRSREKEHIKAWMTRTDEKWTPKFKEFSTSYARRCVFLGSTNDEQFLDEDPSGQRRWLPLLVGQVSVEKIIEDCQQLWAEAKELFTLGGIFYEQAERLAKDVHDDFVEEDAFEAPIREWLEAMEELDGTAKPVKLGDILESALGIENAKARAGDCRRCAHILRKLGWRETIRRVEKVRTRVWVKGE